MIIMEHINVINEKMVANEYLYEVVVKAEWLRATYLSDIADDVRAEIFDACCEINGKLHDLLRLVLGEDTNKAVICRSYQGHVWILELDYFDDGSVLFSPFWPDIDELEEEGVKTLVGEAIEVFTLESYIEEMKEHSESAEALWYSLDGVIDMYTNHEPAKMSEEAPAVKEIQVEEFTSKEKVFEAEGE